MGLPGPAAEWRPRDEAREASTLKSGEKQIDLRKMMLENWFQDFSVGCELRTIPVHFRRAMIFGWT